MQPARLTQADFLLVEINNTKVHESSREVGRGAQAHFPKQRLVIEPKRIAIIYIVL